jgi:hypothetical protein
MSRREARLKALSEHYEITIDGSCSVRWTAFGERSKLESDRTFPNVEAAENDCIDRLIVDLVRIANEHAVTFSE